MTVEKLKAAFDSVLNEWNKKANSGKTETVLGSSITDKEEKNADLNEETGSESDKNKDKKEMEIVSDSTNIKEESETNNNGLFDLSKNAKLSDTKKSTTLSMESLIENLKEDIKKCKEELRKIENRVKKIDT